METSATPNGPSNGPSSKMVLSPPVRTSLRNRIHHMTWAWFTSTMSTGGIALLLASTPHRFGALTTLGDIVFIFDISLFLIFSALISARFVLFPGTLSASLCHPTESLFFPSFLLSISNIISNMQIYGGPHCGAWLVVLLRVLFWTYSACTFVVAVGMYCMLFTGRRLAIQSMTPAWIMPIFPLMLTGTQATILAPSQTRAHAAAMLVAGLTCQGLGMMVACFMYANYFGRLLTGGLPSPNTRPGMFITVGPPSFTALALIGMANDSGPLFDEQHTIAGVTDPSLIPQVLRIMALIIAIALWALAFWFFSISLVCTVAGFSKLRFHLTWWSFVFPNVGFTIMITRIGQAVSSEGILWLCTVMTIGLVLVWLFVSVCHVRAVWRGEIMWPGKDEDRED